MRQTKDPLLTRRLTDAEVRYVFAHLGRMVEADKPIETLIDWPRTAGTLRKDCRVRGVPVLFSDAPDMPEPFEVVGGRVVVAHDLVKSAFFLLSAYQEWASGSADEWGRFPYEESIQKELGIEHMAVVNHYFMWMTEALLRQCRINGIRCQVKSLLGGPSLHLSHDVDTARYFTLRKSLFRCAQTLGLRRCDTSRRRMARAAAVSLLRMAGLRNDPDPYWSFDFIQDNEAFLGFKSEWFFLPDDGGPFPPDYDLTTDAEIRSVIDQLSSRGNTISLHAPINCNTSAIYAKWLKVLQEVCPSLSRHVRQHFLAISAPRSFRAMQEAGLSADFSFGFSRHEGFRNSYCMPFRPFDHDSQSMLDIEVVPLAMMDVSCLVHRHMCYDDIFLAAGEMLDEVRLFGGVFSLLWHNSTFDEVYHPGVTKFYEDLHLFFSQYQLRQFTLQR